jgi:hypothetical protein
VASAGTPGALAGLVFVGLSITLGRILQLPGIPGRAGETILLLAAALVGTLLARVALCALSDGHAGAAAGRPVITALPRRRCGSRSRWCWVVALLNARVLLVEILR